MMTRYLLLFLLAYNFGYSPSQVIPSGRVKTELAKDTPVVDTMNYIKTNVINKKNTYVGQELNVVLKDLNFPVQSYTIALRSDNKNIISSISLSFYNIREAANKYFGDQRPIKINIIWQIPLPSDSSLLLYSQGKGEWTAAVQNYYGKQIVGDIGLTEYKK